jgi:hypothetical protein
MHPYYINTVLIMDINIANITLYFILKDLLILGTVYIV